MKLLRAIRDFQTLSGGAGVSSLMPAPMQAKIGDLLVDCMLTKESKFDSDVTDNPIETGFVISDHVIRKPLELTMEVVFTPTPVTFGDSSSSILSNIPVMSFMGGSSGISGNGSGRMNDVVNGIMAIYQAGEPITIETTDAIYTDMVMTSAPLPRSVENGYCYRMSLTFRHVVKVTQRTEEVPEDGAAAKASGKAGVTEKAGGAASQTEIGTGMTTRDGATSTGVSTSGIDFSNSGGLTTGMEQTATAAATVIGFALGGAYS